MTFVMLDSTDPRTFDGVPFDALAGYVDGNWPTYHLLDAHVPAGTSAHLVSIAVFASGDADILDIEKGDATNAQVYGWMRRQLKAGRWRPGVYTSASNLAALLSTMGANGFTRSAYRVWSAHYGSGEHICGPKACAHPQADGTQWTDTAHGRNLDQSLLGDSFFAHPRPPAKPTTPMLLLADGKVSLRAAVHAHATTVQRALWLMAQHHAGDGAFGAGQAIYIAAGNWNAPMPPKMVYWVG